MNSAVIERINRLENLLQSGALEIPVVVRFTTAAARYLVAVSGMDVDDDCINITELQEGSREIVIRKEDLLDVVAFQDARGRPVFLHDFDSEGYLPAEVRECRDRETFVDAVVASEEYRLIQMWVYDFSHGRGHDLPTTMPSTLLQHCVQGEEDQEVVESSEVLETLRTAA